MKFQIPRYCLLFIGLVLLPVASSLAQSKVELRETNGRFQLLRNGAPFVIKGVGGDANLKELAELGANAIRTWDCSKLGSVLDEAHKHGLAVCAGMWMGHQRHGFNYQDANAVAGQMQEKLAFVRKHKNHPALLMWAVGNEAEGDGNDPSVYYAINHLAREIKKIDPNHPTLTVIAELGPDENKVKNVHRFCPDIDLLGINSYAGIESLATRYSKGGGKLPYVITEHGPPGPWEVGKTSWGSPIEITSTEKGRWFAKGYRAAVINQPKLGLGSFAFFWGHKQETSATWFGMLLPDGSRLGAVDAMSEIWTGRAPKNRCPQIKSLQIKGPKQLKPGQTFQATVDASDPENDALQFDWVLRSDKGVIGEGGDFQADEATFRKAVKASGASATVTMPENSGGYRLFAYVRDGKGGAAVANISLQVQAKMREPSKMKESPLPYIVYGENQKKNVYVPSGYMGNAGAIKMDLECIDDPHSGRTCLKAEYQSTKDWGGVLWQSPAEDWDGKHPGGANLTGATHLEFRARGARGGETVNFVFGVLDGDQPYRDSAKGELPNVKLTKDWKRYAFPLQGLDLRQIKTGFGWSLAAQGKPVTFYLDDIRFVKQ